MAISKINRVDIIGIKEDKDEILSLLQKKALIELLDTREESVTEVEPCESTALDTISLPEIEEAISYLASFKEKEGLAENIVKIKPIIHEEKLKNIIATFDYKRLLSELTSQRNHLRNLSQHRERLIQERQLLLPWRNLNLFLDQIHPTHYCGIILGVLASRHYEGLINDLEKEGIGYFCEIVNSDTINIYLVFFYLKEGFRQIESVLKNYHFNFVTLTHRDCTARQGILDINSEILIFDDLSEDVKYKIKELAQERLKLMAVYDYLANIKSIKTQDKNLTKQRFTFKLSGWVKTKDVYTLRETLADKFKSLEVFISEPTGDRIPVDLENPNFIQPFEVITKIYGMPKYNELDPTPFLAPFFFLYFGLCVSDVGYGLVLIAFCLLMLKRFPLGQQGIKFFRLFLYCGVSTVIVGALTGSWFGNLIDIAAETNNNLFVVKRFKDSLILLNPLKEPTRLLGIVLCLGIIQVWFGNIIAAVGNIKNRRYLSILCDQVTMLVLLFGLTGFGLIFLKLLDNRHIILFKDATLIGIIGLVLTQGRSEKTIGSKLFYGFYNLYINISGYLSDILSYSRLWALGLVTSVMAGTINLLSIEFSKLFVSIIPFVNSIGPLRTILSAIILVFILLSGHLLSFFMNLLGAFVHPVRLQFVEFFSKFFKSGGNAFRPLKIESKYIKIAQTENW